MRQIDLADLELLAAVARARSFRGAARQRGVSPSVLSDAVRRLEDRLGVLLLIRTTRSVAPTEAGARLLDRIHPALAELTAAIDQVGAARGTAAGTLRLNVPSVAADLVLAALIEPFLAAHPEVRLEVTVDDRFSEVLADGFDAGIRYGEALAQDMIAIPIGPRQQRFITVASPTYLARRGTPQHPTQVMDHDCIVHRFASGVTPNWEYQRGAENFQIAPRGPVVSNRLAVHLAAVHAGLGLFHSFEGFLEDSLAAGTVVRVLPDWEDAFDGPFLYFSSRRLMPGPLRAFVDFIKGTTDRTSKPNGVPS